VAWAVKTYVIHNKDLIFFEYYEAAVHIYCAPPNTSYLEYWVYNQIIKTCRFD